MCKISEKNNKPSVGAPKNFQFFKRKICLLVNFESFYKLVYSIFPLQNQYNEGGNEIIYKLVYSLIYSLIYSNLLGINKKDVLCLNQRLT